MASLSILQLPDPRLRHIAKPVLNITAEIIKIVDDMYDTMYANQGVGLAATQVGINWRIFVMDVSEARDQRICAINPEILSEEGSEEGEEGCLSVGLGMGIYDKVTRKNKLRFRAQNIHGKTYEIDAEGLMARCVQHEIDHLNGILYIDHLSRLKQDRIRKKIEKETKKR